MVQARKGRSYFDQLVIAHIEQLQVGYIANGIGFPTNQLPNAAIAYKNRFGRRDLYPTGTTP